MDVESATEERNIVDSHDMESCQATWTISIQEMASIRKIGSITL